MLVVPFLNKEKSDLYSWYELIAYGTRTSRWWKFTIGIGGVLLGYVLFPSVKDVILGTRIQGSVSKRKDKYTTGLVNKGNYCYINSVVQALSSLEHLSEYFNELKEDITETNVKNTIDFRLHEGLIQLMKELQCLINTPSTTTTRSLIQPLETIYQSRLSSAQNDAHEFLQLVLERLDNEIKKCSQNRNPIKLPFQGQISEEFTCVRCQHTSRAKVSTFSIFEVHLPQRESITLEELLRNNSSDVITDYSCLVCNARSIISLEESYGFKGVSDDLVQEMLNLKSQIESLKINDDISARLEAFFNTYSKYGYNRNAMKSTIFKRTTFIESPSILAIHLSRSTYNGMVFSRNNCKVKYPETLVAHEPGKIVQYRLRSLVKHTGTHYAGHYQCYRHKPDLRRDKTTKEIVNASSSIGEKVPALENCRIMKSISKYPYWLISDSSTKEKKLEQVLDEQKSAYLLFYEKVAN